MNEHLIYQGPNSASWVLKKVILLRHQAPMEPWTSAEATVGP
jgi:hypothetical protein